MHIEYMNVDRAPIISGVRIQSDDMHYRSTCAQTADPCSLDVSCLIFEKRLD
jgi:hypothetical protein